MYIRIRGYKYATLAANCGFNYQKVLLTLNDTRLR